MKRKRKTATNYVVFTLVFVMMLFVGSRVEAAASIVSTTHAKYTYAEMVNDLKQLENKYGDNCQVNIIGKSADNRNMYEVVLGNREAEKHFLVIANLHAREYMTTQLCMRQIEYYLSRYNKIIGGKKVADVLNEVAIHYVPSCNPDGTAISQFGKNAIKNKKLRKRLKKMPGRAKTWKANARGVDLNRNWDVAFFRSGRRGSSGFHGTKPASEPEIKALVKWIDDVEWTGEIKGIVSYHSTGSIIYGRCSKGIDKTVKKWTNRMSNVARKLTGYRIMPTQQLRRSGGNSREYFLYVRDIPCITLEIGTNPCPLGIREFPSIWKRNKDVVIKEAMLFD